MNKREERKNFREMIIVTRRDPHSRDLEMKVKKTLAEVTWKDAVMQS